jgi:hypothetical protein
MGEQDEGGDEVEGNRGGTRGRGCEGRVRGQGKVKADESVCTRRNV